VPKQSHARSWVGVSQVDPKRDQRALCSQSLKVSIPPPLSELPNWREKRNKFRGSFQATLEVEIECVKRAAALARS